MREPKNKDELIWHLIDPDDAATFPRTDDYLLLSFENFSLPCIGRCEGNDEEGFRFFWGDDEKPLLEYGLLVNAWMPIPERWDE
jgi:hypothetical protein